MPMNEKIDITFKNPFLLGLKFLNAIILSVLQTIYFLISLIISADSLICFCRSSLNSNSLSVDLSNYNLIKHQLSCLNLLTFNNIV